MRGPLTGYVPVMRQSEPKALVETHTTPHHLRSGAQFTPTVGTTLTMDAPRVLGPQPVVQDDHNGSNVWQRLITKHRNYEHKIKHMFTS